MFPGLKPGDSVWTSRAATGTQMSGYPTNRDLTRSRNMDEHARFRAVVHQISCNTSNSKMKIDWGTKRTIWIFCGFAPLFYFDVFRHAIWGRPALYAYLATAILFGILLEYPAINTGLFWKLILPIVALHAAIIAGIVWVTFTFRLVRGLPGIALGIIVTLVMFEWRIAKWIIRASAPATNTRKRLHNPTDSELPD